MPRRPPFHSADPQKIYSRILDGVFSFPAFLSEAACSLVAKLCRSVRGSWGGSPVGGGALGSPNLRPLPHPWPFCRRRPGQRLGNTATGIRGIKKHR